MNSQLDISPETQFVEDAKAYIAQCGDETLFRLHSEYLYPILTDYKEQAGAVLEDYFFQDIFVATQVAAQGIRHIFDIGSRLDGYISHLLSMQIKVTMIDIRPLDIPIEGLDFVQGDATNLTSIADQSIPALSSLHALEHFGLGRYGDPVDYRGWLKALNHCERVLSPGGSFFLSVPSGKADLLQFNAHRIFRPATIIRALPESMCLTSFTHLHDGILSTFPCADLSRGQVLEKLEHYADNEMGVYDCGIFVFTKSLYK